VRDSKRSRRSCSSWRRRSFSQRRSRAPARDAWRRLARHKLAELDEQLATAQAARAAITHVLRCPYDDLVGCPTFRSVVAARLAGQPLSDAHRHESATEEHWNGEVR
jgi:hypothetical protein